MVVLGDLGEMGDHKPVIADTAERVDVAIANQDPSFAHCLYVVSYILFDREAFEKRWQFEPADPLESYVYTRSDLG
jgi:hypothetical protein